MKKTAVLVLCHSNIDYIGKMAERNENVNFYIHVDKKAEISNVTQSIPITCKNVFIIKNRVSIFWAGFSMIEATLELFKEALKNDENYYFHLISGACVFLKPISVIEEDMRSFEAKTLFLETKSSKSHRYRLRFNVFYANTKYQRYLISRVSTKVLKLLDRILPVNEILLKHSPFGSQWFSGNREGIEELTGLATNKDIDFFKKKLCPDEHFFQYLLLLKEHKITIYNNRRYIVFSSRNHPDTLSVEELRDIGSDFWIARKVTNETAISFLSI